MTYSGLNNFIALLEGRNELQRIKVFADPLLEIAEITDRITKSGGKALLFEQTGTSFPVLINAFGSDERVSMALGRNDLNGFDDQIQGIFNNLTANRNTIFEKIAALPSLLRLAAFLPSYSRHKGICQQIIHSKPDLGILPVLKCWPHDGGRFITLPIVHTVHPESGNTNVGMYRMQILDKNTTAMHWQRHKTGAGHFEAWKKTGRKMPVSVALGGDPVYAYSATSPLPENMNEYILAGFLRRKKVKMVKCITNELFVPSDADIVIEGFVDPAEDLVWEGPFGDHTGFYSLADWYPKFHVTCITHSKRAVYPATIVGIPPQEDVWLAKATEKIFLSPVKMTIQPEIEDFHMPDAGVAHNLIIVKINKTYPGQGMKVINSLSGAGQMMFTKFLVVVSGEVNIRNYSELASHAFLHIDFKRDLIFSNGPLDVLDHSSDNFSYGGKLGIDGTVKHPEERRGGIFSQIDNHPPLVFDLYNFFEGDMVKAYNLELFNSEIPVVIISVDRSADPDILEKLKAHFRANDRGGVFRLILAIDYGVEIDDLYMVAWQVLGNTDPKRDHEFISAQSIFIDGTIKAYRKGGFSRKWPNVVCSDNETITSIDAKWESMELGQFVSSPSLKYSKLLRNGNDEIIIDKQLE